MEAGSSLHHKLATSRKDLLDLTTRNRLLSTPVERSRTTALEIVDEKSEAVFNILVTNQRNMTFLPVPEATGKDESDQPALLDEYLVQPEEEEELDENGGSKKYTDTRLQTNLTSSRLQNRLLQTFYNARTYQDEHGVNILYLALGFLKWYEADSSDKYHYAPLLLIPVNLHRASADCPFRLSYSGDDLAPNLSLEAKLDSDFGLKMPGLPDAEELSVADYFSAVASAVSSKRRWEVLPDRIVLWFFSFSKFLMYRDLDPDSWPIGKKLSGYALINGLLETGFRGDGDIFKETKDLDEVLPPKDVVHVMDADSSQTIAVEEVRRGRNLIIQGPPGTGKSQTITNLISAAVKEGKKVLFLAEKMAALEVVKRRLDNIRLGDMCLELHSHKANKMIVLEQLRHTLELGRPVVSDVAAHCEQLKRIRDQLNRHAKILHSAVEPSGLTPYRLIGEMVRLQARGVTPGPFSLKAPQEWPPDQLQQKLGTLRQICMYIEQLGTPAQHPWRGVRAEAILPTDLQRIAAAIARLKELLDGLVELSHQLASQMKAAPPRSLNDVLHHARFAARLAVAPDLDVASLQDRVWENQRARIADLVKQGVQAQKAREQLGNRVSEAGWQTDVVAARRNLAAYGRSLFRWFKKDYRDSVALLRGIVNGPVPKTRDERVALLENLISVQQVQNAIREQGQLGGSAFGKLWQGANSDWTLLAAIEEWDRGNAAITNPQKFRQVLASVQDRRALGQQAAVLAERVPSLTTDLERLFQMISLDLLQAFGQEQCGKLPLDELQKRIGQWATDIESVTKWIAYRTHHGVLASGGASELATSLYKGDIRPEAAEDLFLLAYYECVMRKGLQNWPDLAAFDGQVHDRIVEDFKNLDLTRIKLARQEIALAHYLGIPHGGDDVGEVGVIWREIHKKRRHLPVRQLLTQAGAAIQAIKPVFMMSPMSVAQFLQPGTLDFDLLIIDEASQVRPVEALGAVARCRQMVVVGDDKQLPPTRFFDKTFEGDGDDEEDQASDLESILGLCASKGVTSRMLEWHYRSRHHSLIAVSNREFYDGRLFIVPSPFNGESDLGLRFRLVADGVFERGTGRCNRPEARAVAQAVMDHARKSPEVSLGVGAFSISQRDAILDELELLRRQNPSYEQFFSTSGPEPFFVKNLETIQGDERDVVFISVGYGKDESGYMAMGFGPVSSQGGERRLNVLISRARARCEVFSSITADDIDLARVSQRGPRVLKSFLAYAQKGILDDTCLTGREADSVFEEEVAKAIQGIGYQIHSQVGVAGFFIDLAIVDPLKPGRYLLGVECDGAAYHSSRSARDRDRLRQQVLEDRGWRIHRVWSTDWFYRPEDQLRKLAAAIERAKVVVADPHASLARPLPTSSKAPEPAVTRTALSEADAVTAADYVEASFAVSSDVPLLEVRDSVLAEAVATVVDIEAPIHKDEVARRLAVLWGQARTGKRIAAKVQAAIRLAEEKGKIHRAGGFCLVPGRTDYPPRNRQNVGSGTLRQPDYLPPQEIRSGLVLLLKAYVSMSREEASREVSRLLGFKALSEGLREVMEKQIDYLLKAKAIQEDERGISLP